MTQSPQQAPLLRRHHSIKIACISLFNQTKKAAMVKLADTRDLESLGLSVSVRIRVAAP